MTLINLAVMRLEQENNFSPTEREIAVKMLDIVNRIKKIGRKKLSLALDK